MRKIRVRFLALAVALGSGWVHAASDEAPAAPVPVQITSGQKVFISNAQGESDAITSNPNQTYNEFYAAMKDWGHCQLVEIPTAAELIFEIRFLVTRGTVLVSGGNGGTFADPQVRLAIYDRQTHVLLWAFTEQVKTSVVFANDRRGIRDALGQLVNDVKELGGKGA